MIEHLQAETTVTGGLSIGYFNPQDQQE